MKRKVVVRRAAELEANRAAIWYEERQRGLGAEFIGELRKALTAIADRPLSFPTDYRDFRKALLDRFPYKIYFLVTDDEIRIIAVLHGSQSTRRFRGRE